MKPHVFDYYVAGNIIDRIDKSFLRLCTSLESNGVQSPKELSYYEFNAKIDYFEEINKTNSNRSNVES